MKNKNKKTETKTNEKTGIVQIAAGADCGGRKTAVALQPIQSYLQIRADSWKSVKIRGVPSSSVESANHLRLLPEMPLRG